MIAERALKIRTATGIVALPIRLFAPSQAQAGSWTCRYEIDWPEGRRSMDAGGADAMQALLLAFYMIGSELYTSDYHKSGQILTDPPNDGYGFPVPASLRMLLRGADREFF